MYQLKVFVAFFALMLIIMSSGKVVADEKQGPYWTVEGPVTQITSRMLVINDKQYPISIFARVFKDSFSGQELPLHNVVGLGKIDKAKIFILGGKVEKIIVINNL